MKRRNFLSALGSLPLVGPLAQFKNYQDACMHDGNYRKYWSDLAYRIAFPILDALSRGKLKESMPVESLPGHEVERSSFSHTGSISFYNRRGIAKRTYRVCIGQAYGMV